jgi:Flp pilus assembly protein TadD
MMTDPSTLLDQARAAHMRGDLAAAAEGYARVLTLDPSAAKAVAGQGIIALQTGKTELAIERLTAAAGLDPADAGILNNLGNANLAAGRLEAAESAFDRAVTTDPALIDARYNRAVARQRLRRTAAAEADYRAVLDAEPGRVDAAVNLAGLYRTDENPAAGIAVLEALNSDAPEASLALAALLETIGRAEEAAAVLERLPSNRRDDPQAILTRARLALRAGAGEEGLAILATLSETTPAPARRQALALRALLLDRLGRADAAFEAFERSNAALRATRPDAEAMAARFRRRIEAYAAMPPPPDLGPPAAPLPFKLVFFCGFPRSGTTLMEQILDAHPETATTGEDSPLHWLYETLPTPPPDRNDHAAFFENLNAGDRDDLRARFVELVTARRGDLEGATLIDKLPLNLIELGIVARLFPEARVLVALRDPRDCVLSAFMQPFRMNDAMACLTTLADAAELYGAVFDLYDDLKARIGLPILEYRYEDLIDDFEGTVRAVIAFLDLPWDGAVSSYRDRVAGRYIATPSYMAVSEGLNRRAIGRWRRYGGPIAREAPGLTARARRMGYGPDPSA